MAEGIAQENFYAIEHSEFYNNIKNLTSELKSIKSLCAERHKTDINAELLLLKYAIEDFRKKVDNLEQENKDNCKTIDQLKSKITELNRTNKHY